MFKYSMLTSITAARSMIACHESQLRDEVEWSWRALSESFEKDSGTTIDARQDLETRYRTACQALGDAVAVSKELERLSWEVSKALNREEKI